MTTPAFDSLWGSDPLPRARHGFAGPAPQVPIAPEDLPALSDFDEQWDVAPAPPAPADFADVTGGSSTAPRDPLANLGGTAEGAAAFAHGIAKTAITAPFEMLRAGISTVFGNPTQEELDNPLVRASIINRMGRMPDIQPRPEGAPGPAREALSQVTGLVTAPFQAAYEASQLPAPRTPEDFEQRGELAGGIILGAEAFRHGGGSILEAYRKRQAARAPAPILEPPPEPVARETAAPGPGGVIEDAFVEEPTPWSPPAPEPVVPAAPRAAPTPEMLARRAELEQRSPAELSQEEVQELLQLRKATEEMPGGADPALSDEITRVELRIRELEKGRGDLLGDTSFELEYWKKYLDDLLAGRAPNQRAAGPPAPPAEAAAPVPATIEEALGDGRATGETMAGPVAEPLAERVAEPVAELPRPFDEAWDAAPAPAPETASGKQRTRTPEAELAQLRQNLEGQRRQREAAIARGEDPNAFGHDSAITSLEQMIREREAAAAPPAPVELTDKKHDLSAPVTGPIGADTQVMVHSGQAFPARYRVVEADALRSSHDPHTFAPTAGYPRGIQGRDYQRNAAAQETVRARALDFNADLALNPSRSATEGQPTILPDGTVLAGNERSMHPRIAAELAPEKYAAYRRALEERAATFGLDPAQVQGMQRPVLVRELTSITEIHGGPKAWAEFNRLSDVTATKAKSQVEEGRARAMKLAGAQDALRHLSETIGADETVGQYLGTAHGRTFVKQLLDQGVITKEELGRFTSGEGVLTGEGRDAIRQMLLSTAVQDPAVLIDAPPLVVTKLEHAVPNIVALRGTPYDPSPLVTAGLRALGDARAQGLTLKDYGGQGDLLGAEASRAQSPLALEFAAFLENKSKMAVAQAFRRFATLAREAIAAGASVDMFGGTGWTPATAFRDAFDLAQEFKVGQASRGKRPRVDAPGLFGDEDLGGFFSSSGAEGPVGSRPAGETPSGSIADALQQLQRKAPLPPTADLLTSQGKFSAEEIAARPEAIQSEELGGVTEHAKGQRDLFAAGQGSRSRRVPAEAGGPIVQALRERATGKGDDVQRTPEGTPLPDPGVRQDRVMPSLRELRDSLQALVAADTVSEAAGDTAGTVRWKNAERAHAVARAEHRLREAGRYAAELPREQQFALDDAIETGAKLEDPQQAALAGLFRQLLDREARMIRRLGTGKLQQMIENYLPHIWTDPEAAAAVIGSMGAKRPLEGSKSFLKKRTIATMREGLEAGLIPVTYNPVELALLKYREMRRYRMAVEIMKKEKREGRLTFVPSDQTPRPGLKRIEDPAFSVFGPPTMPIKEGFDAGVREQLNAFIGSLPELRHQRTPKIGMQNALGYAVGPKGDFMATRFGTESVVIMHELGHILDFRYGLWDRLIEPAPKEAYTYKRGKKAGQTVQRTAKQDAAVVAERKQMKEELRALADLRWEGQEPSGYYKAYVRDKYEQVANAIHALIYAPEKMQTVAPGIRAKLTRFLKGHPQLRPLLDIKPSLRVGEATASAKLPGFPLLGHYYAEAPVARVLNNFLSPGLRGKAIYDAYMGVGNTLNQAQLGLSAFHVGFTSFDVATSKIALGIEQLRAGRPIAAAKSFAAAPAAPITTALKGLQVRREYLTPGSAPRMAGVVKALDQAGGRVLQDERYSTGSWKRLMDAIHERKPVKGALNLLPGLIELAAAPIFEHIVPAQKLGVFADLTQLEMSKMTKDTTPTEARRALGRVWESVDNRLGMMVYDNLFWHKTFKDVLHASVRAVGWNVGTVRELGGGLYDLQKLRRGELTHRAAYVIALPIMAGMAGAVITYLYTGQGPQSLKDYFYPPTGKKNKDGNVERIQLPSYLKDLVSFARHPVTTVSHKVHPLIGVLGDMLSNEDFFGNQIRNPHDPLVQQLQQEATYLLEAVEPLGIRNARKGEEEQTRTTKALNFIGITPAPREMVRTDAQNRMAEVMASRGHGGGTPEEVEQRERRRDVGSAFRTGAIGVEALTDSMHAGVLTRGQRNDLMRHQEAPYVRRFKQLSWDDAEDVYRRATPSERAAWWPLLVRKRVLALRQLSQAGIHDARTQQLLESLRSGISLDRPGEPLTVSAP